MPQFTENVKIDCSGVIRFGMQQDPRFVALYWQMQNSFGNRAYGRQVCLHEAAHAELMEQDGIQNVRFAGPDIAYNSVSDSFLPSGARTIGDDQPYRSVDDDYIFKTVCHLVAGEVMLRLEGIAETGHAGDLDDLKRMYAANPPKSGESPEALWKRAQDAVATRLSDPATKQKVQVRAEECFRLLYPSG